MDPRHLSIDERLTGRCVYCGAVPDSRDHCPSKVLLDEPFPANLPIVEACAECNNSFSLDEQYVACLIECVICGSVNPNDVSRQNIKRILADTPRLAAGLSATQRLDDSGSIAWDVDRDRVRRVVLKLARGHIAYEFSLPKIEEPEAVSFVPLILLSDEQRSEFESPGNSPLELWPEIDSRAFKHCAENMPSPESAEWTAVQPGRYRYSVSQSDGDSVRLVLSEYLACHVAWH
ncbi:MAG: hypothetical protein ABFD90_20235 [Phycisphaerales bacterium]